MVPESSSVSSYRPSAKPVDLVTAETYTPEDMGRAKKRGATTRTRQARYHVEIERVASSKASRVVH